ncbi:regulator of chromosome condensation [Anaeramoeba flamelloides]|uniref:Regulator of chromosome condensation n=1 Tax=Anaeramoeba flamelloides TaxID=1746091 RepID=A0ABQ8Z4C8_9EUKA|nr:regulator of chromosome condensation [Anaeramoeba flamelloides]
MNQNSSKIFISCIKQKFVPFLVDQGLSKLPDWANVTHIEKLHKVKKILVNGILSSNCLIWKGKNTLEFYQTTKEMKRFQITDEEIIDIQCGFSTFLILTKSGKVFSLAHFGQKNWRENIPLPDPENSCWEEIRAIPFFNDEKNTPKVKSISMLGWAHFFLCEDGKLYASGVKDEIIVGINNFGSRHLNETNNKLKNVPILFYENVSKIFSCNFNDHLFFSTTGNELFVFGYNTSGQLGIGNKEKVTIPQIVPNWKASDILDIRCLFLRSILITKEGRTFSCGSGKLNGHGKDQFFFTEIEELKNKKVIEARGGFIQNNFVLTIDNELFGWGFSDFHHSAKQFQDKDQQVNNKKQILIKPHKINLPQIYENDLNLIPIGISCGLTSILIYPKYKKQSLLEDFKMLFESKKYCDSKLIFSSSNKDKNLTNNGEITIPVHKLIIELRTNLTINEIQKIINKNNFSKEDFNTFLNWVYFDKIKNKLENIKLKTIFTCLNLMFPPKNKLKNDLLKLFNDQNSKDFYILAKNNKKGKNVKNNHKILRKKF